MSEALDRLAEAYGLDVAYENESGHYITSPRR